MLALTPLTVEGGRPLVVVDASLGDATPFVASFGGAAAGVVIGTGDDLFALVGAELDRFGDVSAIHLVSHGASGSFTFGSTRFALDSVDAFGDSLVAWNRLAAPGADLYLWGCDIAGGDGAALVDSLHEISGFGVAASTDVTGPARLGGNFELEYVRGDVSAPTLVAGVDVLWDTTLASLTASAGSTDHAVFGGPTVVDAGISASAVSAASVNVTISSGLTFKDLLAVPATVAGVPAYTRSFDAPTGVLTITASSGSFAAAEIEALFRKVTFAGAADRAAGNVSVTFSAAAATATKTVAVTLFTETQRDNLAAAFATIQAQIGTPVASLTTEPGRGDTTEVPFTGRTVSDLFYPSTGSTEGNGTAAVDLTKALQPTVLGELLKLQAAADGVLGNVATSVPTPASLAAALQTALDGKAASLGATTTLIDVRPRFTTSTVAFVLDVTVLKGTPTPLDLDRVAEDLGITVLSPPDVTVGGGGRYEMTVSLDRATSVVTVSFDADKTGAYGGVSFFDRDADIAVGMLGGRFEDASGSAGVLLPLDFGGTTSRTVAGWGEVTVNSFAAETGFADFTLPIAAAINGTTVTTANTKVVVADTNIFDEEPPVYTTTDFDTVRWFAGITPERVIQQLLDVGSIYGALGDSGSDLLGVTVPFVADTSLGDLFDFKAIFDAQIGSNIDIYEPILNTTGRDELIDWRLPRSDDATPVQSFYSDLRGSFAFGVVINETWPIHTVSVAAEDRNTLDDLVSDINAALGGLESGAGIGITAESVANKLVFKATNVAVQSFAVVPVAAESGRESPTTVASSATLGSLAPGWYTVTGTKTGTVTGTNFYGSDTPLGAAAVHAGLLAVDETGVAQVHAKITRAATGSTRHAITSVGASSGDVWLVSSGAPDLARLGVTQLGEPLTVLDTADSAGITATLPLRAATGEASFRVGPEGSPGTVVTVAAQANATAAQTLAAVNGALSTAGVSANVQARLVTKAGDAIPDGWTGPEYLQLFRPAHSGWTTLAIAPVSDVRANETVELGFLVGDVAARPRPAALRTFDDFTNASLFPDISITPVYTPPTDTSPGYVTMQFTATGSGSATRVADISFKNSRLGQTTFGGETTTAASSNGQALALATVINVASTAGFPSSGTLRVTTSTGPQLVNYSEKTATSFTITPGGTGTLQTGNAVVYDPRPTVSLPTSYGLAFGVQFNIGPSSPAVLVAGAAPVADGKLTTDAEFSLDLIMQDRYTVTVEKDWTDDNATVQDLVSDLNRALGQAMDSSDVEVDLIAADRLVARYGQFSGRIELVTASRANDGNAVEIDSSLLAGELDDDLDVSFTYAGRTWTITLPAADTAAGDTLQSRIGQLNTALADAMPDTGEGESLFDRVFFTTRSTESGVEVLVASTDPPAEAWPATVRLTAARTNTAVTALGFSDGGSGSTSEVVARASGVTAAVTPYLDDEGDERPFATGTLNATLPDLFGSTMLGFNTIVFGDTSGSIDAKVALTVPEPVAPAVAVADLSGSLTRSLTNAAGTLPATAGLTLESLSATAPFPSVVGQDPPTIKITVADLTATTITVDQAIGVPMPVPSESVKPDGYTLSDAATIYFIANSATYSVTVTPDQTDDNESFADLVDDFNDSLAAAAAAIAAGGGTTVKPRGESATPAGDLSEQFVIKAVGNRLQVFARVSAANPNYGTVTLLPNINAFGELGLQGSFGVATVADALADALAVFDTLRFDVAATATTELPLLGQPLAELIALDSGLARRIDTLRAASVSSPAGLAPAISRALGITSEMVNVSFDTGNSAYRIDVAYDTGTAISRNLNLDLTPFFALLGQPMPAGLGILNDGGGASPLEIVLGGTSVLSVGIDLTDPANPRTFLYGHDGGGEFGLDDGTSFEITFRVEGEDIAFTAGVGAFGIFIREGTATIGGEVITVGGKEQVAGTAGLRVALTDGEEGSVFYLAPEGDELNALDAANYAAAFSGVLEVSLPLFAPTEFTPVPNTPDPRVVLSISDLGGFVEASERGGEPSGIAEVLTVSVPDLTAALEGDAPTLFDLLRDPALFLDGIDVFLGTIETALRGLSAIPLPVVGDALGDAAGGVFGWRRGWLREMKAQMRGAGESVFEAARDGIFEHLGPDGIGILLEDNGDRTVGGMIEAASVDAVTLAFVDDSGEPLDANTYGAHGVEFRMRLGQQILDTGLDLDFSFDALAPLFELSLDGGLRFQLGWDMYIGFGFNLDAGFYVIVDPIQPEAQLRFDAFLDTASRDYTVAYDDGLSAWVVVDGSGNVVNDPATDQPMRAVAVNKDGIDVTPGAPGSGGEEEDDCGCGDQSDVPLEERTWWVVAAQNSSNQWVPATFDQWNRLVPATGGNRVDKMVEITAVAPLTLRGDLFFLTLQATDKVRLGLRGVTEYDSRYRWGPTLPGAPLVPQADATARDNPTTGVNRNNELPTLFSGVISVNVIDPSVGSVTNTAVVADTITGFGLADKTGKLLYPPGKATATPVREFFEIRVLDLATAEDDGNGFIVGRPLSGVDPILVPKNLIGGPLAEPLVVPVEIDGTSWLLTIPAGRTIADSKALAEELLDARFTAVVDGNLNGVVDPGESATPMLVGQVSFGFVAGNDGNAKDTGPIWWIIEPPAGPAEPGAPPPTVDDWQPLRRIKDDPSKNRVTFDELRVGGFDLMQLDMVAQAVVNFELDLSIADSAAIPRVLADLNLDWSTAARQPTSGGGTSGTGGIDPKAGTTRIDLLPEVGLSNIRLDVGSFLTDVIKPIVDELDKAFKPLDPVIDALTARIPVLSDIAGRKIELADLLSAYGGPKGKAAATLIDAVAAVRDLVDVLSKVPDGVSLQLPMGRFWLPKENQGGRYAYGEILYDNAALGIETGDFDSNPLENPANVTAAQNALAKLEAKNADNPKYKQPGVAANKRGGFRFPILQDPVNVFQLLMGRDAVLVTYSLPEVDLSLGTSFPLIKIFVLEVGLRFQIDVKAQMHFGYDTYGIRMFVDSGDVEDLFHGFYISDRAKADGSGADVDELYVQATIALYGGVDLVLAKAGIEGGFTFTATVNLNDPNNDGKLRFTEMVGLIAYTGNPLDIVDITMRGEVYARYYYWVGLRIWTPWKTYKITIARGGKTFARKTLFTLVFEGSDGPPTYASKITSIGKNGEERPGTLLLHAGSNAPKRVSNQDPLKTKDGAERFKIWNSGSTVYVQYLNYSTTRTETYTGVSRVLFDGGLDDDELDASGLHGLPIEFFGGAGDDEVLLGSGSETLLSILDGGAGDDTIDLLGGGRVRILGGLGDDEIDAGTGIVTVNGNAGADTITTGDGSTATLLFDRQYGVDTLHLSAAALVNLLDFTESSSGVAALLAGVGSTVSAGAGNIVTFNLAAATELRGSEQRDRFTVTNPTTRAANGGRGLVLRGGLGDDAYEITADAVTGVSADGITIDDTLPPLEVASAGAVTRSADGCGLICEITVADPGLGYTVAPDVVIVDPTGSGARAVASLDEQGRVTRIIVTRHGRGYTDPQVYLVNPASYSDKLVFSSTAAAATLDQGGNGEAGDYRIRIPDGEAGGKDFKFVGWTDVGTTRPDQFDASEIDSVTVNLPQGVLTLAAGIDLFDTFTVNAHRMEQNARIVADTVSLTTDHGFQVRYAIDAVNNGDVTIRSTGDNLPAYVASWADAVASVAGSTITGITITEAGDHYWFAPSITFAGGGGSGARAWATVADGKLTGITVLDGGSGYLRSPRPQVVIAPPASIQVDAMITSTNPGSGVGYGDGRGRVLLYADNGSVVTSGEVFFPFDTRPGAPQGARTIDWLDGDFRYRSTVALDDLVDSEDHPGISVGTGAAFTAEIDADGRVVGFTRVSGGGGYSFDLPPSVEIEGLATAVAVVAPDGSIESLRITYPGEGYGSAPRVTVRPNGFGRIVDFDVDVPALTADGTPLNRVHIQAAGGRLVTVAGVQIGDPAKPLKSDVETFVAQTLQLGGSISLLEKDGLRIGRDLAIDGILTVDGDVTVTTFGGALELGAPVQRVDGQGRLLWQDDAKTIPIYERDADGNIVYEGGQIRVGDASVKLTADDIEVNVPLNAGLLATTGREVILQPVKVDAEIGLAGTRARVEAVMDGGGLAVEGVNTLAAVPGSFWGGRGYLAPPTVVVAPPGERAFGTASVRDGAVQFVELVFAGTNYSTSPVVTLIGGGIGGATPANPAVVEAVVGDDGSIIGFTVTSGGSGYVNAPRVDVALPGQQARVVAILDTANPDPVSGRFAVSHFEIVQAGSNYSVAPRIEVEGPYAFTLDADEIDQFNDAFETVVIGRIEGKHLIHSPQGSFKDGLVLRAPRAGGRIDMNSLVSEGAISIVGSGNTYHFDTASATMSGTSISIDDNVIVHAGVSGSATATAGSIIVFGTGKGMIDGDPTGDDDGDNEDLLLAAHTSVTVTGAIGSRWKLDDLTVTSASGGTISLDQSVSLTGDLDITGGAVTIGGIVDVAGNLVIDASSQVTFSADVSVDGNVFITGASGVTFAGSLTVGGTITFVDVTGTVRFGGLVTAAGEFAVTAAAKVEFLGGLAASDDVTLTSDEVEFRGGVASIIGPAGNPATGTLVIRPFTASRSIRVGTPTGSPSGTLDISDTDLAAIAAGWKDVVIGDIGNGTGAVTIGTIGTRQGSGNSWLTSPTTIVGGSVTVSQKVDVAATADTLRLVARTGAVTVNAAVNQTAAERNATLRLEAIAGAVAINAPIWASQTVSLVSGTTTSQTALAAIKTSGLRVSSNGVVTLEAVGNAFDTLAVATTDDAVSIRENSGYTIGTVDGVSGVSVGTATATLHSTGSVGQTAAGLVSAGTLSLQGAGGSWTLDQANTIGTLTADTGRLTVVDTAQLTVGSLHAATLDVPAIDLYAPGGLTLAAPITTAGGHVTLNNFVTLATDVVIDVEDAGAIGRVNFIGAVDGTTTGQESLVITGHLYAAGSIGSGTALESFSVSGDATLGGAGSVALIRTVGDQTFSSQTDSAGTVTVQAGSGATVKFLGDTTFGGLITAVTDTAAYAVRLTGSTVAITNAVAFANTGSVTLGNAATDDLHFVGGVSTAAASGTNLAGTIRTTAAAATFGRTTPTASGVVLEANTTVSTGTGAAAFAGTVNGPHRLVVNAAGDTTFAAAVGGGVPLAHLETDAVGRTLLDGGSVTTGSPTSQIFNDAVLLGADTVLTAHAGGGITFAGTVGGAHALTLNTQGTVLFQAAVNVASLATDLGGTTRIEGGGVTTSGAAGQVYGDAVVIGVADATLTAGSAAPLTFAAALDAAAGTPFGLTARTAGTTRFDAAVCATAPLAFLTVDGGGTARVAGGSVRTGGDQQWLDATIELPVGTTFESLSGGILAGAATVFAAPSVATPTQSVAFTAFTDIGTAAAPIRIAAAGVTAAVTGPTGDIFLVGVGDLVIGAAGLMGPGSIALGASGAIRVPSGGRITAGSVQGEGVTATKPIRWSLLGAGDSGAGSLRQVIDNVNTAGVAGVVVFTGTSNRFTPATPLPSLTAPVTIDGTGHGVVLEAQGSVATGFVFAAGSDGSTLRGVTVRGFATDGIVLQDSPGTIVQGVVIQANANGLRAAGNLDGTQVVGNTFGTNQRFGMHLFAATGLLVQGNDVQGINTQTSMGLYATGDLTGTRILANTFAGGLRGALLDNARELIFGQIGQGNMLTGNRAAPTNRNFAGTGIRAQGDLTGTTVTGNVFTQNNYGFAFIGARNLSLSGNSFTRNSIAGIYIEGDSRGSTQTGNTFGRNKDKNKQDVVRVKGSSFGPVAVSNAANPTGNPATKKRK